MQHEQYLLLMLMNTKTTHCGWSQNFCLLMDDAKKYRHNVTTRLV